MASFLSPRCSPATLLLLSLTTCLPLGAQETPAPSTGHLVLHKWSGAVNVPDPVACAVDPQGRVYVATTGRRRLADLDIRQFPSWEAGDLALTSVDEKAAFLKKSLSPEDPRAPRGSLTDQNGDGSLDWKDLTFDTERIFQMRDTDGDGTADKITVFAEGFATIVTGVAAGVMYHDGWVYATIAPDLWRFKDTNDDGVADVREIVVHGFAVHIGFGGHDMHGLMVGPDGRIYWSMGDKGVNVTTKDGRHLFYPTEGTVLRMEPDGSAFEVYAHGLRNVQEPAFDDFGDLIGVDNDGDFEGERERFVYIPEGSDSGWRFNHQFMGLRSTWMKEGIWKPPFPGQACYFLPPISNYSDGPGGFKRDPGTALNDAMRGIFLLNEFPSGKMRGFRVERDGASFKMVDAAVYNEGIMGVGMSWHPDGSLLMVDWLGGWVIKGAGAIWRVDARDGAKTAERQETHRLLQAGFGGRAEAELVTLLGYRDQRVRIGAQMELAKRSNHEALLKIAQDAGASLFERVHGIWGYGQLMRRGAAPVDAAFALLKDPEEEIRTQAARIIGDATSSKPNARALVALLDDAAPRVRLQTAIALGKLKEPSAVEALFARARVDFDAPVLRHAIFTGLTGCATVAQLTEKKNDPSVAVRLASVVALRRLTSPAIAEFLKDTDEAVAAEAARGIHDDRSIMAALPQLGEILATAPKSEPILRRSINANLRIGSMESAARLLNFSLEGTAPFAMREEALTSLRLWPTPAPIDRIDGHARKFTTVKIDQVLLPKLDALLALSPAKLKTIAIEIMIAHSLHASPAQIAAIVADADAPGSLRAQALKLMGGDQRKDPAFARSLQVALSANSPAPLYRAALELLLPDAPDRLVTEARTVMANRSVAEKQHVLSLLAKSATKAGDKVLAEYATMLATGSCPPELQLDVIEALTIRSTANPVFATALESYAASPVATTHAELALGGDTDLGQSTVLNNLAANCSACHSFKATGGSEVGPNLSRIGASRTPAYLVEALINPSAAIAPGYGVVSVTLKDGSNVTGTLAQEAADEIIVRLFDGARRSIARAHIAEQTPGISVMPPMLGVLTPRELRDVAAYLSSLRPAAKEAAPKAEAKDSH